MRRTHDECDVLVIGGGAAGMMAGITASGRGRRVILCDKNEKLGKKLYITGKGRCNLTNACPESEIYGHIVSNGKFMYSAIRGFPNADVMDFFEEEGLKLKTERGDRVFPDSDHSSDVIKTLNNKLQRNKVDIRLETRACRLIIKDGTCEGAVLSSKDNGEYITDASSVIVATGGLSYPSTGSTGDGYRFAEEAGLNVRECTPSLVPFDIRGDICERLMGLTLKNVTISVSDNGRRIYESRDVGEMLFTHFGVSGPLILTASSEIDPKRYAAGLILHIDLKPGISIKTLDQRIMRDFLESPNKEYKNSLGKLLPSKLIPVITGLSGIDPYKKVNGVTKEERMALAGLIKDLTFQIEGTRGFDEAVITKGGVSVKEIDPKTMEAKHCPGLYFAGEVLDLDAHTGGFNLQIAWSTGYAAGSYA